MQVEGLARYHVDPLRVRSATPFANLDVVTAGAQVHRLILVRRAGVGAIDEHLRVLYLRVQLDFTRVGATVIVTAIVSRTPIRSPIWGIPTAAVIWAAHCDESADGCRSTHRRQREHCSRQNHQQSFSPF